MRLSLIAAAAADRRPRRRPAGVGVQARSSRQLGRIAVRRERARRQGQRAEHVDPFPWWLGQLRRDRRGRPVDPAGAGRPGRRWCSGGGVGQCDGAGRRARQSRRHRRPPPARPAARERAARTGPGECGVDPGLRIARLADQRRAEGGDRLGHARTRCAAPSDPRGQRDRRRTAGRAATTERDMTGRPPARSGDGPLGSRRARCWRRRWPWWCSLGRPAPRARPASRWASAWCRSGQRPERPAAVGRPGRRLRTPRWSASPWNGATRRRSPVPRASWPATRRATATTGRRSTRSCGPTPRPACGSCSTSAGRRLGPRARASRSGPTTEPGSPIRPISVSSRRRSPRAIPGHFPDPLNQGRFLPRVSYWQGWNEPNLSHYLTPQWNKTSKGFVARQPRPVSDDGQRLLCGGQGGVELQHRADGAGPRRTATRPAVWACAHCISGGTCSA